MDGFFVAKFKKISDKTREELKAEANKKANQEEEGMDIEENGQNKIKKSKKYAHFFSFILCFPYF